MATRLDRGLSAFTQAWHSKRWWAWALVLMFAMLLAGAAWYGLPGRSAAPTERLQCALPVQPKTAPHPGMVWVPGGSFELGDGLNPEELPLRQTRVSGFWMDRTEVSNDEFAAFVAATGYVTVAERPVDADRHPGLTAELRQPGAVVFVMPKAVTGAGAPDQWWRYLPGANWRHPGGPDTSIAGRGAFPVVTVTIADAQAYARWRGHSLPSEAQWEWAARAGQARAAQDHDQPLQANTWQGLFPMANSGEDGFVGLAPVGCYAPNALGLFDMIGNVWELTADAYQPHHRHAAAEPAPPDQAPAGLRQGAQRVIKGGSFLCAPNYCARYRSGSRQPQDDDLGASHLGFRTVLNAAGPAPGSAKP